eukprot:scaffold4157_cov58-Attheya_sp.AAC.1
MKTSLTSTVLLTVLSRSHAFGKASRSASRYSSACRRINTYNLQTTGESHIHRSYSISTHTPTRRFMSSPSNEQVSISQIGKLELKEIVATIDTYGREDSGYVVMDVRGEDE